ncbi:MAG: hypothetical protein PHF24_00550 [Syntrophomonas sp.]|nr:hypothetical protein [Syntrophomonas sp.]
MNRFFSRVEKGLIRIVILGLLLMVVVQGLMTVDPIRFYLSWGERMEGQSFEIPVNFPQKAEAPSVGGTKSPHSKMTIGVEKFSSLPRTKILINGQEKYNFSEKLVTIEVNAGDTVEIDSTAYNFPIDYKVMAVSSNLAFPDEDQIFTANQTMVMIGTIIVK